MPVSKVSASKVTRRAALAGLSAGSALTLMAAPGLLRAQTTTQTQTQTPTTMTTAAAPKRNTSSFAVQEWRDHFETLGEGGAIVCDLTSRVLHFWSADGSVYKHYPTSVPLSEELTRRGYTQVVRKKVGPSWTPTQSMRERDPTLPEFMPPGPGNPLGTHAMYLDWPAYLIHGTHDTRKIGRRSSSGCVGLYNEQVAELYDLVPIGCQVRLI